MNQLTNNKKTNNILGVLLVMPIIIVFLAISKIFSIYTDKYYILPIIINLPVIIGIIISFCLYKEKTTIRILLSILIIGAMCFSCYYYYNTYYVDYPGWTNLSYFVYWLIATFISKTFSAIFYGCTVGWKKGLAFYMIYVLLSAASFFIGLWG